MTDDMIDMKVFRFLLCCALALLPSVAALAQNPATQQIKNTARAVGAEELYRIEADSIKHDKVKTEVYALLRHQLKMADKRQRETVLFDRNSPLYIELVRACTDFTAELTRLERAVSDCHLDMGFVRTAALELMTEAYSLVRTAIVTGMSSNVPHPFRVSLDRLLRGEDDTPVYADDPQRPDDDTDGANLLLPDERLRIVNHAVHQLRGMTSAMRAVVSKLTVDVAVARRISVAPDFRVLSAGRRHEALRRVGASFASYPLP